MRVITANGIEVAVMDQASKRIRLFGSLMGGREVQAEEIWSWSPEAASGFERLSTAWGLPTDAKIRYGRTNRLEMAVTDSLGLAAIVPYPEGGSLRWGLNAGGNPHSAELLPDGNIAVAASTGGWVRLYASSQGPDCSDYAEYRLPGAHGVQWDPLHQLLWALGDDELIALKIEGTEASPRLRDTQRIALPSDGGHDLQPVYGDKDRLWVSTRTKVYQFVKSSRIFDEHYAFNERISRAHVKSIGNDLSGRIVFAAADGVLRPETGYLNNDWCTDRVECGHREDALVIPESALYKARVWNPDYQ